MLFTGRSSLRGAACVPCLAVCEELLAASLCCSHVGPASQNQYWHAESLQRPQLSPILLQLPSSQLRKILYLKRSCDRMGPLIIQNNSPLLRC